MKKNRLIPLIALGMLTSSANAVIKSNWSSTTDADESKPEEFQEQHSDEPVEQSSSEQFTCNDGRSLPLGLLKTIMPNFDQFKVNLSDSKKTAEIEVPQYMKTCMKLKFKYTQVDNDIFISATNEEDLSEYPGNNFNEKYENCLRAKGVISEDNEVIESKAKYTSFDQAFNVDLDTKSNMNVHFSSPRNLRQSYGTATGGEFFGKGHAKRCFKGEEIVAGGLSLYESPFAASMEHYETICNKKNPEEIFDAFKELISNTGNATVLDDDIRKIIMQGLKAKMGEATDSKLDEWNRELEDLGAQIKKSDDEDEVKELAEEYNELLGKIEKFVLDKKIDEVTTLYNQRKKTKKKDEQKALDKQIKALTKEIGVYSKKGKYVSNGVITKMLDFGLKEEADDAFSFKLKSAQWAAVSASARSKDGYPTDPKKIAKTIKSKEEEFDRVSTDKEKEYSAKMGYGTYSKDYGEIAQQLMSKRSLASQQDTDRIQEAYQNMNKYCSQTSWTGSSSRCSSAQKSYQYAVSAANKRYSRYNTDIMYYTNQANKFYTLEKKYADENSRSESSDPYGYDGFDDFSLLLNQSSYTGNTGFSSAGQFSMTGQYGGMVMPGAQTMNNGMTSYMGNPYTNTNQQQSVYSTMPVVSGVLNTGTTGYSNMPTYSMP